MPLSSHHKILGLAGLLMLTLGCVDQIEFDMANQINIITVEGRLTDEPEEQVIKLNRSKVEYGRFGNTPISSARVELHVNAQQAITLTERDNRPGEYVLPEGFRAIVGASYQLRFQLADGTQYESSTEIMPAVPAISSLSMKFDADEPFARGSAYKGVHSFYIDTQDPAGQENFYSWEYALYEKKKWCRTCQNSVYAVNEILPEQYRFSIYYVSGTKPFENCFTQPVTRGAGAPDYVKTQWKYDYQCRDQCWEILRNTSLNLFEDRLTNGGKIMARKVARAPYYQCSGALIKIRQLSFTRNAYEYFRIFQAQTQSNGGIEDTPPSVLRGNIRNIADDREVVVGYFTASSVSSVRHWIDREDTGTLDPPGLFEALNERSPSLEPNPPDMAYMMIWDGPPRVPKATCLETDHSTSVKPEGWLEQTTRPDCLK